MRQRQKIDPCLLYRLGISLLGGIKNSFRTEGVMKRTEGSHLTDRLNIVSQSHRLIAALPPRHQGN